MNLTDAMPYLSERRSSPGLMLGCHSISVQSAALTRELFLGWALVLVHPKKHLHMSYSVKTLCRVLIRLSQYCPPQRPPQRVLNVAISILA